MADGAGSLFWYNRRWYDYTGTTFSEMAGWGWRSVHHPDHVDRVVEKFREHIVSGEPWEDVFPLRSRGGEYRWFLSRAMPIRDDKGEVTLWCGTNTDITEDRKVAQRLRQKARLIELSHEAIFVWDLATGIVAWNRGCRELYGHTAEEAIGAESHALLQTTYPVSVTELTATLKECGSWSGQVFRRSKSGREVWVDARQELIDTGERELVLETNRDVTEKRKADELTRLLLSEVVHRVKNTLAIIQAITSQTARRSRSVAEFEASFNSRLQALSSAHNLLTSTAWAGAELRDVVAAQIGDDCASAIRICGPSVVVSAQTALQLGLITFELASNARKHGALSAPGGQVDVSWSPAPEPNVPDAFEVVWRESGGPPVPRQRAQGFGTLLIERFGRQPNLKTCLELREDGARCTITVTAQAPARSASSYFDPIVCSPGAPAAAPPPRADGAKRVLIVEDEPLIAMDIEDIVAGAGHASIGVSNTVGAALTDILKTSPDVVILDGNLFGKPVNAVIDLLRARGIPFVMVTGFSNESLPRLVGELGTAVVRKPIDQSKLLAAIEEAGGLQ
jgi:PAS domain S-box-containing protein